MKFLLCLILSFLLLNLFPNNNEHLLSLSLEELMNVKIESGTLTGIEKSKFPGTMTIISSNDIKLTPAKNILDLIEIYVPGATYVSHYQGFRLGIRGSLSDQNYSYQMLLNGKNINLKASYGAFFELQDKDLQSIERIEIISGSGSAVYGPGATAGVINIITKEADKKSFIINHQNNLMYRYRGNAFQLEDIRNGFKYYLYGSITNSEGLEKTKFYYVDRAYNFNEGKPYGWGFMGPDWGNFGYGSDAPNYYEDYMDEPEIKLHFDLKIGDNFNLWSRYSTYNLTLMTQSGNSEEGKAFQGQLAKYYAIELNHKYALDNNLSLKAKLGFDSACFRSVNLFQGENQPLNHIAQKGNSYSENEFTLQYLLNYNYYDKYKFALGSELSYEYYAPEWGDEDESFIMSLQAPIGYAVLNKNSQFYQYYGENVATDIDRKIDGNTYSFFGEANLKFCSEFQTLISTRIDKHEYSDYALSPRIALISEFTDKQLIELIFEKSVRLPLFSDLFAQHYLEGENAEPEVMKGVELIHNIRFNTKSNLKSSLYYYSIDQISWIDETEFTDFIGTFNLLGFETEYKYKSEKISCIANYSFIHQLDWDPEIGLDAWLVTQTTDNDSTIFVKNHMSNYGENRINNLPAHTLKLIANHKILPDVTIHFNSRLMWDYQQNDMIDKFVAALRSSEDQTLINTMDQVVSDLQKFGYGKTSFTSNAAVIWSLIKKDYTIDFRFSAQNLITYNNIRYIIQFWESGDNRQFPRQCGFIKEPLTVGIDLEVGF